jgi:hypothetical protein
LRARELIIRDGWTQDQARDHHGRRCAGQAIEDAWMVTEDALSRTEAIKAMHAVIGSECIPHWNDQEGRTYVEVVAAFDRAIERLRPKPEPVLVGTRDFKVEPVVIEKVVIDMPTPTAGPIEKAIRKALASVGV